MEQSAGRAGRNKCPEEEQDCAIAEYVVSVFEELTK